MSRFVNVGIDLGTTNSCIAVKTPDGVRVYQNNLHGLATPSAVQIKRAGRMLVGLAAKQAWVHDPDNTEIEFKRWMGQSDRLHFPAADKYMSAEELSAEVLKALLDDAQRLSGERPAAAVVTVPAAFTQLQSGATQRAAKLAGLVTAPVLQEPIAAALAYGWSAGNSPERWLVFDLGGGTFDVAVVSTKGGRLAVIDHAGDNELGGKNIDEALVDTVIKPRVSAEYRLPMGSAHDARAKRIRRQLIQAAERAKIELTHRTTSVVEIENMGEDLDGRPILLDFELTRSDLERAASPSIRSAIELSERLLARAQRDVGGIDRVVLVGGPTQMPLLREALADALRLPIDASLDPMTAVAEGAAIYASTVACAGTHVISSSASSSSVRAQLEFAPTSKSLETEVDGRIDSDDAIPTEVRIEAESGFWNSGWLPLQDEMFSVTVHLEASKETRFWVHVRDAQGRLLELDGGEFSIRHGLEMAAPPLPHDLRVEVLTADGEPYREVIFPKNTALPRQRDMNFRAAHRVVPGDEKTDLPIKIFEGEQRDDLASGTPNIGVVFIRADSVARVLPADSDIVVDFRIDESRTLSVTCFVPYLAQDFEDSWSLPDASELNFGRLSRELPARLEAARASGQGVWDDAARDEIDARIAAVEERIQSHGATNVEEDPDLARRVVEETRKIECAISAAKERPHESREDQAERVAQRAERVVQDLGGEDERSRLDVALADQQRALRREDRDGIERANQSLTGLTYGLLLRQPGFLKDALEEFESRPADAWTRPREARSRLDDGRRSLQSGDVDGLREAVVDLWGLLPPSQAQLKSLEQLRSGLRRY